MAGAAVRSSLLLLLPSSVLACTTLVVGKKATADGSVLCSHSNEARARPTRGSCTSCWSTTPQTRCGPPSCHGGVPRRRHGARRRARVRADGNQSASKPIGEIPQIPHTPATTSRRTARSTSTRWGSASRRAQASSARRRWPWRQGAARRHAVAARDGAGDVGAAGGAGDGRARREIRLLRRGLVRGQCGVADGDRRERGLDLPHPARPHRHDGDLGGGARPGRRGRRRRQRLRHPRAQRLGPAQLFSVAVDL